MNDAPKKGLAAKTKSGVGRIIHWYRPRTWKEKGILWTLGLALATYVIIVVVLGIYWSQEPGTFDVRDNALELAHELYPDQSGDIERKIVPGFTTTAAAIRVARILLYKPGGYLSNDISLPSLYLDNIPNWEFGALVQLRDMTRAMRNDFARSQTQSIEDKDLQVADPQFNFDSESWILPSTESEYKKGIKALLSYARRLSDERQQDGQFYVRADNLRDYLAVVEKRLGSFSQRLGASVVTVRYNINLAGDRTAVQSTPQSEQQRVQTPWMQIDDVFYEARGGTWAILEFFRAIAVDFEPVLKDKNAVVSLRQVIRELEGAQQGMWSPIVLNGMGFGPFANHSLVLASYISRANAAVIDLRQLLAQG